MTDLPATVQLIMRDRVVNPSSLKVAWQKYTELFGEAPHGTQQQFSALLEFIHDEEFLIVPLETARLLNNAFLPLNPNKLRNADPEVKRAAIAFSSSLSAGLRNYKRAHEGKDYGS